MTCLDSSEISGKFVVYEEEEWVDTNSKGKSTCSWIEDGVEVNVKLSIIWGYMRKKSIEAGTGTKGEIISKGVSGEVIGKQGKSGWETITRNERRQN